MEGLEPFRIYGGKHNFFLVRFVVVLDKKPVNRMNRIGLHDSKICELSDLRQRM